MKIILHAPDGGRPGAPVAAFIPLHRADPDLMMGLIDTETGRIKPIQVDSRGRVCWWEDPLEDGQTRLYKLHGEGAVMPVDRVVVQENPHGAEVLQRDALVARFHASPDRPRPCTHPLMSPSGRSVTRESSAAPSSNEEQAGCWVGWGDVDGVDHWSLMPGHGRQRLRRFGLCVSGAVFGRITAVIDWLDAQGRPQLVEQRILSIFSAPPGGPRIIDLTVRLAINQRSVTFGDTPDGGLCALRVTEGLSPAAGGAVRNSEGQQGPQDCWGARANWCGCTGRVDGQPLGVIVMDHPGNLRYPTHWTVTDDGLLAANPFGLAQFLHQGDAHGGRTWPAGDTHTFRYRLLLHDGLLSPAEITRLYVMFAKPVQVDVE